MTRAQEQYRNTMSHRNYEQAHARKKNTKLILAVSVSAVLQAMASTAASSNDVVASSPFANITQRDVVADSQAVLCETYAIQTATADGDFDRDFNPSRVIDGNLDAESRWSAIGDGRSIILDLGSEQPIHSINTAWYRADERQAFFDVDTSSDASDWNRVLTGAVAEDSEDFLTFQLDESNGRYVRITGRGNSLSEWNSLIEVTVSGCTDSGTPVPPLPPEPPQPPQPPEPPQEPLSCDRLDNLAIVAATSDGSNDADFNPSRAIDNDLSTESRWSANGTGRTITFDLGELSTVRQIATAWYRADVRQAFFDVETSTDNSTFETVLTGATERARKVLLISAFRKLKRDMFALLDRVIPIPHGTAL